MDRMNKVRERVNRNRFRKKRSWKTGDIVWVYDLVREESKKKCFFDDRWIGPGRVMNTCGKDIYMVKLPKGAKMTYAENMREHI